MWKGGVEGMRMLLRKIWLSFLCASMWTQRFAEEIECFHTSQHTLSFSFPFSRGHNHNHTHCTQKKKEKGLALFLHSLAGDPEAEPGGRETQLLFPAPNLQRLPMKRETVQLDFIVDRQHGYPDSGTPNTSSAAGAAQK